MTYRMRLAVTAALCLVVSAGVFLFAQDPKSDSRMTRFHASLAFESEGNIASALKEMDTVYPESRDDYLVNLRLGWLEYLNADYTKSARYYRHACELAQSRSVEALLGLRLPLAALNDWDAVITVYSDILALDPANYEANLRLGQIYLNRGEYALADPYFERCVLLYPSDYETNLSRAWNDYYMNNTVRSRTGFETILMISPGDTSAARGLNLLK